MTYSDDSVTVSTTVATDPITAFEIFTADVDSWWRSGPRFRPGGKRKGTMRFEPGSPGRLIEVYDEHAGDVFEIGRISAWEPGQQLAFQWRQPNFDEGQETLVEVRFEEAEDGTKITLTHSGWAGIPYEHPARHGLRDQAFVSMIGLFWADLLVSARRLANGDGSPDSPIR